MYRNSNSSNSPHSPSSPIFDVPEFPTLRRVKPLPKRRRTSLDNSAIPPGEGGGGGGTHHLFHATAVNALTASGNAVSAVIPFGRNILTDENGNPIAAATTTTTSTTNGVPSGGMVVPGGNGLPPSLHMPGLPPIPLALPGPDATAEEVLAHADALRSYYMPLLGAAAAGMRVGLGGLAEYAAERGNQGNDASGDSGSLGHNGDAVHSGGEEPANANDPSLQFGGVQFPLPSFPLPHGGLLQDFDTAQLTAQLQYTAAAAGDALNAVPDLTGGVRDRERDSDSDRGDGDYVDHLRQPGNTKKRKVPANHFSHSQLSREDGDLVSGLGMGLGGVPDDEEEAMLSFKLDGIALKSDGDGAPESVNPTGAGPGPGGTGPASALNDGSDKLHHLLQPNFSQHLSSSVQPVPQNQQLQSQYLQQHHVQLTRLRLLSKSKRRTHFADENLDMGSKMSAVMSAATLAGLQHKEMLKSRKRQLATVLSVLTNSANSKDGGTGRDGVGDTLALEQALSGMNSTWGSYGKGTEEGEGALTTPGSGDTKMKVRFSKRKVPRMARTMKALVIKGKENRNRERDDIEVVVPECTFTFVCHSATSDRLIATKEEVILLRQKFEAELNRQAAKTAKAAKAAKLAAVNAKNGTSGGTPKGGRQKRIEREKEREREREKARIAAGEKETDSGNGKSVVTTTTTTAPTTTVPALPPPSPPPNSPANKGKNSKGKKKKRSALANASNPHHLRNYVPSRLPNSGGAGHGTDNNPEDLWPFSLRFLSTELPPKRRKGSDADGKRSPQRNSDSHSLSAIQLTNPADEWICPFCEYELFYGDDLDFRRAVRKRKAILKRRTRARERAAAAASGRLSAKKNQGSADNKESGSNTAVGVGGASGDADAEFDEEAYEKDVKSGLIKDGVGVLGALNRNRDGNREGEAGYG
ncbi:hypothetical protein K435DRAFT_876077 [Dendrothele bispora CBS 962.96]|uniref:Uncharacterized protein n=1 Tax=Dendrothele bispora (strain CBS 962.96) TaxID=1314807 RepID=A0A4S8KT27_DENBC|nr:hypothetical protein K435DRAFT_876077 [Dendrothele bispora CBS 962.96]